MTSRAQEHARAYEASTLALRAQVPIAILERTRMHSCA